MFKQILILLLFVLIFNKVEAKSWNKVDSLKYVYSKLNVDTTRVNVLDELAET